MTTAKNQVCEVCGEPASICVLSGYLDGVPQHERYCLTCADHHNPSEYPVARHTKARIGFDSMLLAIGLLLGGIVFSADHMGITGTEGFGIVQSSGLLISGMLIILGALLSIDAMLAVGAIAFVLAASADLLKLGGSAGIGWKQTLGLIVAGAFILAGAYLRYTSRKRNMTLG
jgi:hypothetical protein